MRTVHYHICRTGPEVITIYGANQAPTREPSANQEATFGRARGGVGIKTFFPAKFGSMSADVNA